MKINTNKGLPIWGWPILFLFLTASGLLVSYIGSDFIVAYAHWSDGIWWGISAAIALAGSLWCAQVKSPTLTLLAAIGFFLFIAVNTQINYYKKSKFELFTIVQKSEESEWPAGWKNLDRNSLYQNYINQRISPTGFSWLDHLRLQADIGIISTEQQGHRKYGGRKGVEVYRQGFWIWWGWFLCYLLLAIGCFIGMAGSAFVTRKEETESDVSDIVVERMYATLKEKGLDEESIKAVIRRPKKNARISDREILNLLPIDESSTAGEILRTIKLSKEWRASTNNKEELNREDLNRIHFLLESFYSVDPDDVKKIYPYYLTLLSADKLFRRMENKSFYDCMTIITDISALLSIHPLIPPFQRIDLTGIEYKSLSVGELWEPLFGGGQSFYAYNSSWELLENNNSEDIPEDAYLAIIYQYFHQPDPRGYEMWQGTTPSQMVAMLSPRLRDAILTSLSKSKHCASLAESPLSTQMQLAAWAANWPEEKAAEFFNRCIQSGWRASLRRLPETPFWREFIDKNNNTPFGELSNYVDWYT